MRHCQGKPRPSRPHSHECSLKPGHRRTSAHCLTPRHKQTGNPCWAAPQTCKRRLPNRRVKRSAMCFTHAMKAACSVTAGAALIVCALTVAGCGSSQDSKVSSPVSDKPGRANVSVALYQSPEQATLSWFSAINHKDRVAAVAHFTRAAAGQMNWGGGDTSTWSTFSALRCKPAIRHSATTASVYCTFKESQSLSEGNPDSFWTVYLHRQSDGRWLITGYGQP